MENPITVTVVFTPQFGATEPVIFPITIPSVNDEKEDLETVFRYCNHVDNSEIESQLRKFRCRSMCSEDYVMFPNGNLYLCEFVGWKRIR